VDSLYARDQAVGGAALLRQALMHWQYARRMLGESSYTEPVERQLLAITSELAICTWFSSALPCSRDLVSRLAWVN
jgi:hypothetical protein